MNIKNKMGYGMGDGVFVIFMVYGLFLWVCMFVKLIESILLYKRFCVGLNLYSMMMVVGENFVIVLKLKCMFCFIKELLYKWSGF